MGQTPSIQVWPLKASSIDTYEGSGAAYDADHMAQWMKANLVGRTLIEKIDKVGASNYTRSIDSLTRACHLLHFKGQFRDEGPELDGPVGRGAVLVLEKVPGLPKNREII
jgi:hypothetical protein